jgi:hypothetical protein
MLYPQKLYEEVDKWSHGTRFQHGTKGAQNHDEEEYQVAYHWLGEGDGDRNPQNLLLGIVVEVVPIRAVSVGCGSGESLCRCPLVSLDARRLLRVGGNAALEQLGHLGQLLADGGDGILGTLDRAFDPRSPGLKAGSHTLQGRHPCGGLGDDRSDPLPRDFLERRRLRREMRVEATAEIFTVAIQSVMDRGDILGVVGDRLLQGTPLQILSFESIAKLLEQFGLRRQMFGLGLDLLGLSGESRGDAWI